MGHGPPTRAACSVGLVRSSLEGRGPALGSAIPGRELCPRRPQKTCAALKQQHCGATQIGLSRKAGVWIVDRPRLLIRGNKTPARCLEVGGRRGGTERWYWILCYYCRVVIRVSISTFALAPPVARCGWAESSAERGETLASPPLRSLRCAIIPLNPPPFWSGPPSERPEPLSFPHLAGHHLQRAKRTSQRLADSPSSNDENDRETAIFLCADGRASTRFWSQAFSGTHHRCLSTRSRPYTATLAWRSGFAMHP
ncbi:hypothetical protein VUR80DRAFT_8807 [Thermomyces stellatus]